MGPTGILETTAMDRSLLNFLSLPRVPSWRRLLRGFRFGRFPTGPSAHDHDSHKGCRAVLVGLSIALLTSACERSPAASQAPAEASAPSPASASRGAEEDVSTAPPVSPSQASREIQSTDVPLPMRACFTCHRPIVETYLRHGMAESIGPVTEPPVGTVTNDKTGNRYDLSRRGDEGWLLATTRSGGSRRQRIVGRIGAGILDTSWATAEVDPWSGQETGRLFFAPVETIAGQGPKLSPFENAPGSAGIDMELTHDCLTCHTLDRLEDLPGAATDSQGESLFPRNAMGSEAFAQLSPFACDACHGSTDHHVELMTGSSAIDAKNVGLRRLGSLSAPIQRDVCARCHLQGDARLELTREVPREGLPSVVHWPVLVPEKQEDEFRFVSQLERLVESACFQASTMTCTTCHDPHTGVREQGVASFDRACQQCHESCSRPGDLTTEQVTGEPPRTEASCVDCHVRRSQPFDLPHVRSADHWVRRSIPPPQDDLPHRQFAAADSPLKIFDDGRLKSQLSSPEGQLWQAGVMAVGLATLGKLPEAAVLFERFPPPGSAAAVRGRAPEGWAAVEETALFHQVRALVFQSQGKLSEALAAYSDALSVNPKEAGARMARARLRFHAGDFLGLVEDTQILINDHPRSEQPWILRAQLAQKLGRADMAASAFTKASEIWPSSPQLWFQLAQAHQALGQGEQALRADRRARDLNPELPSLR